MRHLLAGITWRVSLGIVLMGGLAYIYWGTFVWLGREWLGNGLFVWQARNWSHGPIVVLLVSYAVWLRWRESSVASVPSLWGIPFILFGVALHLASVLWGAPYVSAYSLISVFLGLVYLFWGSRKALRLLVPSLLFSLGVPFPAAEWGVVSMLQQIVATGSTLLADLAGAPVHLSGLVIHVGRDEYVVEPLCSGFNLILALLALVLPLLCIRGASVRSVVGALFWLPILGLAAKIILVGTILVLTPPLGQEAALSLYHRWLGVPFFLASLGVAVFLVTYIPVKARLSPAWAH